MGIAIITLELWVTEQISIAFAPSRSLGKSDFLQELHLDFVHHDGVNSQNSFLTDFLPCSVIISRKILP